MGGLPEDVAAVGSPHDSLVGVSRVEENTERVVGESRAGEEEEGVGFGGGSGWVGGWVDEEVKG